MDPDATLKVIREQVAAFYMLPPSPDFDLDALVGAVTDLDDWIARGGFLPQTWQATVGAAKIEGCNANGEPVGNV